MSVWKGQSWAGREGGHHFLLLADEVEDFCLIMTGGFLDDDEEARVGVVLLNFGIPVRAGVVLPDELLVRAGVVRPDELLWFVDRWLVLLFVFSSLLLLLVVDLMRLATRVSDLLRVFDLLRPDFVVGGFPASTPSFVSSILLLTMLLLLPCCWLLFTSGFGDDMTTRSPRPPPAAAAREGGRPSTTPDIRVDSSRARELLVPAEKVRFLMLFRDEVLATVGFPLALELLLVSLASALLLLGCFLVGEGDVLRSAACRMEVREGGRRGVGSVLLLFSSLSLSVVIRRLS